MSAAVAPPVLIRKLQCFSDTCAPPRVRPRQPAASISSHAFMLGGIAERGAAGARADRLRRLARRADLGHARRDRRRDRRASARRRARTTTRAGRQRRVAVGERESRGGQAQQLAGAGDDLGPVEAGGDVAAIGAGVHRHRAADACRECRTGIRARRARRRPHARRPSHPAPRRRRRRRRLRARWSPKPRASRIVTPGRPPSRTIRLEQAPIDVHRHRRAARRARNAARSSASAGRTSASAGPPTRNQVNGAERRVRLHAAAQRRQRGRAGGGEALGGHHAPPPATRRAAARLQLGELLPAAPPPIA